jgi:hypothetical protein
MKLKLQMLLVAVSACGCGLLLSGCASVKAVPESKQGGHGLLRWPEVIYVKPFDTSSGEWERNAAEPPRRAQIRDWLMAELERDLADIAPTRILTGDELPASGWLVTGRFIRVNPGYKFARMFIGLGAGASKLETKISVFDLAVSSKEPLITFNTTGGSNLAAGPQTVFNNDSEGDVERTAREARDFLRERLGSRDSGNAATSPPQKLPPVRFGAPAASDAESPPTDDAASRHRGARP